MSGYNFKSHCAICYSLTSEGKFVPYGCSNEWLCSSCFEEYQKFLLFEPDIEMAFEMLKFGKRGKLKKL